MKHLILILLILSCCNVIAQTNPISNAEQHLTNGTKKTWKYYQTVNTMGNQQSSSSECEGSLLTFTLTDRNYTGKLCNGKDAEINTWSIEGVDEDELYINLDNRYMIDIYTKEIDSKKVEILRLKSISSSKELPSVGYLYIAQN